MTTFYHFTKVEMDPSGSIIQKVEEESIYQHGFNDDDLRSETLVTTSTKKFNLFGKLQKVNEKPTIRRTSSFMLRSRTESEGIAVSNILLVKH